MSTSSVRLRVAREVEHVVDREPAVADRVVGRVKLVMSLRAGVHGHRLEQRGRGLERVRRRPGRRSGYQPSVRYWRTSAIAPATAGVAIEVPEYAA